MGLVQYLFKNQINKAVHSAVSGHMIDGLRSPFIGGSQSSNFFDGNETDIGFLAYQQFLWVYNAVFITSTNASRVPIILTKENDDEPITDGLVWELLSPPNSQMSFNDFIETIIANIDLSGNAFIEVSNPGGFGAYWPLLPTRMSKKVVEGRFFYEYESGGQILRFTQEKIIHIKAYNPSSDLIGMSPSRPLTQNMNLEYNILEYQNNFFRNDGALDKYVTFKNKLNKLDFNTFKSQIIARAGNQDKQHETLILDDGGELKALKDDPSKQILIDALKQIRNNILSAYNVPPVMAGILDDGTFNNTREQKKNFWENAIQPKLLKVEAALNMDIFNPIGHKIRFDFSGVEALQDDFATKSKALGDLADRGLITGNEVREKLNLEPIAGLEEPRFRGIKLSSFDSGSQAQVNFEIAKAKKKIMVQDFPAHKKTEEEIFKFLKKKFSEMSKEITRNVVLTQTFQKDVLADAFSDIPQIEKEIFEGLLQIETNGVNKLKLEKSNQLTGAPIEPDIDTLITKKIEPFVEKNVKTFFPEVTNKFRAQIGSVLKDGIDNNLAINDITQKIQEVFSGTGDNKGTFPGARRIARTETLRNSNFTALETMKGHGFTKKIWLPAGPPDDREQHTGMPDKIVAIDVPFISFSPTEGPVQLMFPGDPSAPPSETINCGCSVQEFVE